MPAKKILAWHFTDGRKLRDGTELVSGRTYKHRGKMVLCQSGLHASIRPIDALQYAPGNTISRVECSVDVEESHDKMICRERKVLWCADAESELRAFARRCASDVLHLWAAPDIVKEYLKTGDESKRDAAWDAAWSAARAAARAAAWDAAWAAARDAAWSAARAAAWSAARAAARAAARDAARAAAGDAAWDAAWDAAGDAARDASLTRYNSWLEGSLMSLAPKKKVGRRSAPRGASGGAPDE